MPHVHDSIMDDLTRQLLQARAGGERVRAARPEWAGLDAATVYGVQAAVASRTGPAGAFKVARKPGQPMIMAPIFGADVVRSPAALPEGRMRRVGIELEVGFQVLAPLPPADAPDFAERAADLVAAVPVIEIVDTRLDDLNAAPDLLKLADNQLNAGLVVGAPVRDWRGLDLTRPRARLNLGAQMVLDGPAEVPGGGGLKPGHVVITGSLNGCPWVDVPIAVRGEIEGLGPVEVRFG